MRRARRYLSSSRWRSIAALILFAALALAASGCAPDYGYYGYPSCGYAPYSYGWGGWGYDPVFVTHHPWEDHWSGGGHHTEFYHGGGAFVGHEGGGFHGGGGFRGGGGFHGGGGGHGGGGPR